MIHSVYIHIPFCNNICSYCDFCKMYYNSSLVMKYLEELKHEIELNYNGEVIDTLYIGGGTPSSLNIEELKYLFDIIKVFKLSNIVEFTFECNIDIDYDKLKLLYENKVNRLSIGVQTFNDKLLKYLNRYHTKEEVINKINLIKKIGFNNINIDLIYAIKDQTLKDLDNDLEEYLKLNINHISTYSLIIEPNTKLYINKEKNIDEELDYEMYKHICKRLEKHGYIHYEVSNFAKIGYESRHNLTYWNNDNYYGFGLSSSGYIDNTRYDNTRSINNYLKGKYTLNEHKLDIKETIENEFILGLRKIKGINKEIFKNKYNIDIKEIESVKKLLKDNKLIDDGKYIYINKKYLYTSNDILVEFLN